MQIVFKKREPGQVEFVLIYGGIAILLLVAAHFLPVLDLAPGCAFRSLSGLPCPTCGSTHSVVLLSQGRFLAAFRLNPVTMSLFVAAVVAFLCRLTALVLSMPGMVLHLSAREKSLVRISAVLVILLNWIYVAITL